MPRNPFDDDDEKEKKEPETEEPAVKEAPIRQKEKEDAEGNIEVDLAKVEEEEASEKESQSNRDRRRNRYEEQRQAAREASERAEKYERELAEERARRLAYEAQLQTVARPQQPESDPEGEEIMRIRRERENLHKAYQARNPAVGTPEYEEFVKRGYELNDREDQAKFLRNQRMYGRQQQGISQQDMRREAVQQRLIATYPDVLSPNVPNNIRQYMFATHQRLIATGAADDETTIQRAADETRKQFRIGGQRAAASPPPPSETAKRRLSGSGASAGPGRDDAPAVVRMTRDQSRMAERMFPNMKPEKAHRHWANTVGRKLAAKGIT